MDLQGRNVTLGYGVHLATDANSEMPLTTIVEPANVNEKKIATRLLRDARKHRCRVRSVVADSLLVEQGRSIFQVGEELRQKDKIDEATGIMSGSCGLSRGPRGL